MDHVNTLNHLTPKILCTPERGIDPKLLFGLDSKLFLNEESPITDDHHHNEVENVTLFKSQGDEESQGVDEMSLRGHLDALPTDIVWRVKGYVRTQVKVFILNWAFGRFEFVEVDSNVIPANVTLKLTCMGERDELKRAMKKFAIGLGANIV